METDNVLPIEASAGATGILQFTPLSTTFGTRVSGLDLKRDLTEDVKAVLKEALFERQVLLFRQQELEEDHQVRLAQVFGTCRDLWQNPHYPSANRRIHYLSNVDTEGWPIGRHPDPDSTYWHTDGSWMPQPTRATVLYGIQVPEGEGATQFANMYQLYRDLDQPTRDRLDKLQAEHDFEFTRASRHRRMPWQWFQSAPDRLSVMSQLNWWRNVLVRRFREGGVYHPVVRPHPETGRPALFIGDHAWRITGRFLPTGIRMVRELNSLDFSPEAIYTHHWQAGDLVVWDNSSVLHRVEPYDLIDSVRIMRRCVVQG